MGRTGAVVLALTVFPVIASAAEVTRAASSFEDNHPFGMYVDVGYERTEHDGIITRENQTGTGAGTVDTHELNYRNVDSRMNIDLHIGLWKNLEFSVGVPVVFSQTDAYGFAAGRNASNSDLVNNCVSATGALYDPTCLATGAGAQSIGKIPSTNYRSGLGDLRFGLTYSIFKQSQDPSNPDWNVYLKYEAPTAKRRDPAGGDSPSDFTGVGDKVHRYTFGTAFSRRLAAAEPYFKVEYVLPFRGPSFYSNCDRTDLNNLAAPENCSDGYWSRAETGINAPHVFNMNFGTEVIALENKANQRIVLDFRGIASYYTAGRYYNEASALFQKLMSSDGYLEVGGSVALIAQPVSWVTFRLRGSYSYQTDHGISTEPLGKDIDGDGRISYQGSPAPEVNPTFDYRADLVGRRLRIIDNGVFAVNVSASLNF
jgi:hypothetical protein